MNSSRQTIEIAVRQEEFPGAKWHAYLKEFSAEHSSRSTPGHPIWRRIRGKGFEIWISDPMPSKPAEQTSWQVLVEFGHLTSDGRAKLDRLIKGLGSVFEAHEVRTRKRPGDGGE